jgi:imidazolonepropionase-like amidohydrolase
MAKNILVLRNANLVDMSGRGDRIKKNRVVVIENGRILAVPDARELPKTSGGGYTDVDCGDNYLLPGLIDIHVHSFNPFIEPNDAVRFPNLLEVQRQVKENLHSCVRGGVTTIRDMGSPPGILRFMNMIERGRMTGPRVVPSFSMITCPGGYPDMVPGFNRVLRTFLGGQFAERVNGAAQAEKTVRALVAKGAAWVKTVYQEESYLFGHPRLSVPDSATYAAIARTARTLQRKIALHALSIAGVQKGIELGVDTIEHLSLDEIPAETARKMTDRGITVIPTFIAPMMYREDLIAKLRDIINSSPNYLVPLSRAHTLSIIDQVIAGAEGPALIDYPFLRKKFAVMTLNFKRLREAGVRVGFGTDAGGTDTCLFGLPWLEMQLMAEAGMENYEVLETATSTNAAILGLENDIGSIMPGRTADLVLVRGNPVEDLRNVASVVRVWKGGRTVHEG